MRRRDFLAQSAILATATGRLSGASGWGMVPEILSRIRPPKFPERDFDVHRFGAAADGKADDLPAIRKAIQECHAQGGGRVVLNRGEYRSRGPVQLLSNVNLHLAEGARLVFDTDPAAYLPNVLIRWEGVRCFNYSPLLYAYRQDNLAITGQGVIDGQAARFWGDWKGRQTPAQENLRKMGAALAPMEQRTFGEGHYLRPDLFQPYQCRNLLVEGITLQGSPFWTVHPVFCTNVTVRGIHVLPGTTNDDGVDPDSCRDVLIENCEFRTADDNIAIKAGRDQDAWGQGTCENIVVRGCRGVRSKANGYCIGSEMSGDVRNVFIENNSIGDVESALYIKSNSDRGGKVEGVWFRSNTVETCDNFIKLETDYKGIAGHPYPSEYRDFHFEALRCRTARKVGLYSVGIPARPISGIVLDDVTVENAAEAIKVAHTRGLEMHQVRMNGKPVDWPQA